MLINYFTSAYSGFGNRLRGILSVERAKQECGVDYALNWSKTWLSSCDFKDFLANDIQKTDQFGKILTHRLIVFPNDDLTGYGPRMSNPLQRVVDCEYERIPQSVKDAYAPYFKWLKFQPHIVEKAEQIIKSFNGVMPIGVHYRNGSDWCALGRKCPTERYAEAIDMHPKDLPIYLIVHDQKELKGFDNYGSRIITQPDKCYDSKDPKHGQDVAVEFLVLSRLNNMVADKLSTFTETAWLFGGCNAKVIRIGVGEVCK